MSVDILLHNIVHFWRYTILFIFFLTIRIEVFAELALLFL